MRAGTLNQRCSVKRPVRTTDSLGGVSVSWTKVAETWCSVWPISGRESMGAGGKDAVVSHEIRMRKKAVPALAPDYRIDIGTRAFDVVSVLNVEERGDQWRALAVEHIR